MAEVHRLIKQERHLRKKKDERRGMTEGERETELQRLSRSWRVFFP